MSYRPPASEDSLSEWFSRAADFHNIAPRLLGASSDREFELWFDKLSIIDKRMLLLYLRQHGHELTPERRGFAQSRFAETIWP